MLLLKSYVKEESPSPPLKKLSLTGQVCALAAGVNVRQHPGICGQVIKKKMHCVSAQGTDQHVRVRSKICLRATVQDVYAVYKMHVISQNSRRKESAEGESSKTPWGRRPGH